MNTTDRNYGNIYRNARTVAGLTQERWAEFLGISVDSVQNYERGISAPSDEILLRMADISGVKILPYWHLSQRSRIAAEILPDLEKTKDLPEAVLSLLVNIEDFQEDGMKELLRIASDGKVDEEEASTFLHCIQQLGRVIGCAYALRFANKEDPHE